MVAIIAVHTATVMINNTATTITTVIGSKIIMLIRIHSIQVNC